MAEFAPASLETHDEYPHPAGPEAPPYWTENYWFQAYDPACGVGFMFSIGSTPFQNPMWREFCVVNLPGDEMLVGKQFGRGASAQGPGAALQSFACEKPWQRWIVRSECPARRVTLAEMLRTPVTDGLHEPIRIELDFEGMAPVWDLGAEMKGQAWAHGHYEQACRVRGRFELRDPSSGDVREAFDIDCTGFRDHSQGPRVARPQLFHTWVHGEFPSGRSFSVLDFEAQDDAAAAMHRAYVSDGASLQEARVVRVPRLEAVSTAQDPFVVELDTPDGIARIEGEFLASNPYHVLQPNAEVILGVPRDWPGLVCWEAHVRLRWDGEVGYGQIERTREGIMGK